MTPSRHLLLGPPGTGKTTRLLTEMERRLEQGVPASRIAFVSFTRAAVRDARERAKTRFNLTDDDLPYFRTLHSLCFHQLGLRRNDVFGREALSYLSELTGEELTGKIDTDVPTLGERGDALLFLDQYSRSALLSLDAAWHAHGAPLDWHRLKRFVDAYAALRGNLVLCDFTDMLERYVVEGRGVPVQLVLVDEAQDLTPLQWQVLARAFGDVPELIVAGDDDQGIYHWAGASPDALLAFEGEREVLGVSHRLPRAVWQLARQVAGEIGRRYAKPFLPARDELGRVREGSVEWVGRPDEVDLTEGTWLLLARTRRQLPALGALARSQGVAYLLGGKSSIDPEQVARIKEYEQLRAGSSHLPLWHDALTELPLDDREYLLSCLRRGESLTKPPRVRIDTIHGAKGLEADRVLLLTDLNERVRRGQELDPDSEQRVLYVAITRARESLYLVSPQGSGASYKL